jgi:1-pyrroline-5-carboxylate dehydrogenase
MSNAKFSLNLPINDPIKSYAPGSVERLAVKKKLEELRTQQIEIPLIIGGKEVRTGNLAPCIMPHNHKTVIGKYHLAGPKEVSMAIDAALKAQKTWVEMPWQDRIAIFLKAADLLAGPWRSLANAACMLTQSKNVYQSEIDAACELVDFFRFNAYYAMQIYEQQPPVSAPTNWNRLKHRPLEGFIFAVTPFNFLSIAGNLPSAPALFGNVSLWKPSSSAVYSAYYIMKLFQEAGFPDGVINFLPGQGSELGSMILNNPNLAGIHFTGSTATFHKMWETVGASIGKYRSYPRIVGETGGKDFVFVHPSAPVKVVGTALIRGSFEYQGQKCSASSRAYIPRSMWKELKEYLVSELKTVTMGDVEDFTNLMNAVIDKKAYRKIVGYIEYIKTSSEAEIVCGGGYDDSVGYFIQPTVAVTVNPHFRTMEEEIFGPVLTIYVYEDDDFEKTLALCDATSPYALTGAIISQDRQSIVLAEKMLMNAAGNLYINDKPTAAVVGQQPFGGGRASGTNDKAGSILNLLRWVTPQTIKENFVPPTDYRYPFMAER